jgi:hypothetical protein
MRIFIRQYLESIGKPYVAPTPINVDNTAAICIAGDTATYSRTKHIAIRYHSTQDFIRSRDITLQYIKTDEQIADVMTKGLPKTKFDWFRAAMNFKPGFHSPRRSEMTRSGARPKEQKLVGITGGVFSIK